jgi:prepilin-type N-terminal cleavage/methylation domain-containing protein
MSNENCVKQAKNPIFLTRYSLLITHCLLDIAHNTVERKGDAVNRKRSGFTMIEILVVIGIILILAGMLFIGGKMVFGKAKIKSTRITLDNLAGMLVELDAKTEAAKLYVGDVEAPGDVSHDAYPGVTDRYEHDAVEKTQAAMLALRAMPTNKAALEKLTNEQILLKPVTPSGGFILAVDASGNLNPPILADAWGNPIILVPADGMVRVYFADRGASEFRVTSKGVVSVGSSAPPGSRPFFASAGPDGVFGFSDVTGNGSYDPPDNAPDIDDVPGGDDNIYSFEN